MPFLLRIHAPSSVLDRSVLGVRSQSDSSAARHAKVLNLFIWSIIRPLALQAPKFHHFPAFFAVLAQDYVISSCTHSSWHLFQSSWNGSSFPGPAGASHAHSTQLLKDALSILFVTVDELPDSAC